MCLENPQITIHRTVPQNVNDYIHLRQIVTLRLENREHEIERRSSLACAALGKLPYILKNKKIL